jgi:hypothetical protein
LRARDLVTGTDLPVPTLPAGSASELLVTPDGQRAVMLMSTPTMPWNILVVDLATGELRWLTDARPSVDVSTFVEPVRSFAATTSQPASAPRDGTQSLTVSSAWDAPSHHP